MVASLKWRRSAACHSSSKGLDGNGADEADQGREVWGTRRQRRWSVSFLVQSLEWVGRPDFLLPPDLAHDILLLIPSAIISRSIDSDGRPRASSNHFPPPSKITQTGRRPFSDRGGNFLAVIDQKDLNLAQN